MDGAVAHLQLNRPEAMNTFNPRFWQELEQCVDWLQRAGVARAVVLSSTGKHFTAGMDLEMFSSAVALNESSASGRANISLQLEDLQRAFTKLAKLRAPVIAVIQGGCIGGGVDLICCADIRVCTQDAFFCIQEINIGMVADLGTLQRLPRLIPDGVVREMAYTGRRLPASRALAVGLVNEIQPDHESALASALVMAREIASKPPVAIWGTKQAIDYARDHSVADSLDHMGTLQAGIWDTSAVREAITARATKREPAFANLDPIHSFGEPQR
jgi:enoyl-CoA hydratase